MRCEGLVAAVAGLLLLAGCSGHDAAVADVEATAAAGADAAASPTPTTPAPLQTVAGERVPGAHWVSSAGLLTHRNVEVGPADTVLPFAHAVADWLDRHLDDLQRGGAGLLPEVANPELVATASPADLALVTTGLASPDRPVAHARYALDAAYDVETEWLTATVEVTDRDDAVHAATMVFVPTPDGPQLILFGAAGVAP